jgi:uncharacterized membrane protein (UPF0127 family)
MKRPAYLKGLVFFIVSLVLLWAATFAVIHKSSQDRCGEKYRQDTTLHFNGRQLAAQTAKSEAEREKGIGGLACMGPDQAMLFVFDKPGFYPFWMKDAHFPIDIVWLSSQKEAVYVADNISPSSYPKSFVSPQAAQYVLELKAGQAAVLNIVSGTKFSLITLMLN